VGEEPSATAFYWFLPLFAAFWLLVTGMLGFIAGWFDLQDTYPDRDEEPLDRLWFVNGALGRGNLYNPWGNVSYGGCLSMGVCPGGLRVRVSRLFAPFQSAIYIPWNCITVEAKSMFFFRRYRLQFDRTEGRALTISSRAFERIARTGLLKRPVEV
jgi:hypothetical protein